MISVGITGRKGRGKNTITNYLKEKYGYVELSFAGPLKRGCKEMFGLDDNQLETYKDVVDNYWGIPPRLMFQYQGTEVARDMYKNIIPELGENFWIKRLYKDLNSEDHFAISDCRFPNEVQALKEKGFIIIRINSDVYNNGTKEELFKQIDALI